MDRKEVLMKINSFGIVALLALALGLTLTGYAFFGESEEQHRARLERQIANECYGGSPLASGVPPQGTVGKCIESRRAEVGLD